MSALYLVTSWLGMRKSFIAAIAFFALGFSSVGVAHALPAKNIVVTLQYIFNENTGPDPGNALEVYGIMESSRLVWNDAAADYNLTGQRVLFERDRSDPQSIVEGTQYPVGTTVQYTLRPRASNRAVADAIMLKGCINEQDDFGPNDGLGCFEKRISYSEIDNNPIVEHTFEDEGQIVKVRFAITSSD